MFAGLRDGAATGGGDGSVGRRCGGDRVRGSGAAHLRVDGGEAAAGGRGRRPGDRHPGAGVRVRPARGEGLLQRRAPVGERRRRGARHHPRRAALRPGLRRGHGARVHRPRDDVRQRRGPAPRRREGARALHPRVRRRPHARLLRAGGDAAQRRGRGARSGAGSATDVAGLPGSPRQGVQPDRGAGLARRAVAHPRALSGVLALGGLPARRRPRVQHDRGDGEPGDGEPGPDDADGAVGRRRQRRGADSVGGRSRGGASTTVVFRNTAVVIALPSVVQSIAHRGGHLQVVACAGSGKTETVAQRIASLLADAEVRAICRFAVREVRYEVLRGN
ncbi:MAG: UvrD-helicase domain-containing protein [Deltaproteobacteria bacterium]|nr:UvrD-helicase domain-containing protein [Deltaproteobacteria bacterium]